MGTRPDLPARVPCEHVDRSNPGCERCCKTITLSKHIISLHCGWHHECLRCARCRCTLDDENQKIYRGLPYCTPCHQRLKGDHAAEMKTIHRSNE